MIALLTSSSVHQEFHKSSFIHVYEYTEYSVSTNCTHVICYDDFFTGKVIIKAFCCSILPSICKYFLNPMFVYSKTVSNICVFLNPLPYRYMRSFYDVF